MSAAYSEYFSLKMHQVFIYFQAYFFGKIILKHIKNKKDCKGSRGMLPRKILCTVVAILVVFEQFLRKF